MDARRILSELLPIANDKERATAEKVVPTLDERFFNVTVPVDSCIWGAERIRRTSAGSRIETAPESGAVLKRSGHKTQAALVEQVQRVAGVVHEIHADAGASD